MKQQRLTQVEVAQRLGISQGHVSDLCNGRFWPSRGVAVRIWRLTEGAVTPNDFLTEMDLEEASPIEPSVS
jgi:3,4-dihydroxy 2-butanone 4-phosphate synthase/GTP cyclohydrolase II